MLNEYFYPISFVSRSNYYYLKTRISNSGIQTRRRKKQIDILSNLYTTVSEHNVRQKHRQIPIPIHTPLSNFPTAKIKVHIIYIYFLSHTHTEFQIPKNNWNVGLGIEAHDNPNTAYYSNETMQNESDKHSHTGGLG